MIYIGIDGGGSNLRVAAVDETLSVIAQVTRGAANPNGIGREASAALIQEAVREVMAEIDPHSAQPAVRGVGIGVAGASPVYADDWLRATVGAVLPGVPVATATDVEMALVGAHGERRGIMVVAGTGSVALGINDVGESLQVGGWGFLLGDEGSGYHIGLLALKTVTAWSDTANPRFEGLARRVMVYLALERPSDAILWLYQETPSPKRVADLVPVVLAAAEEGNVAAQTILLGAAIHLKQLVSYLTNRLQASTQKIAFGGGLLNSDNAYSRKVCELMALEKRPEPLYTPVIGAALLAKIRFP